MTNSLDVLMDAVTEAEETFSYSLLSLHNDTCNAVDELHQDWTRVIRVNDEMRQELYKRLVAVEKQVKELQEK